MECDLIVVGVYEYVDCYVYGEFYVVVDFDICGRVLVGRVFVRSFGRGIGDEF